MIDRKEVFDYLRNKQKSAEIEAKVNGINLWVILAAVAIVLWQLVESIGSNLWSHYPLIFRALICAEAMCWLVWMGDGIALTGDDIRYTQAGVYELDSLFCCCFKERYFWFRQSR
jgi:hypothetical protein